MPDLIPQAAEANGDEKHAYMYEGSAGPAGDALEAVFHGIDVDEERKISFDEFAVFAARCAERRATRGGRGSSQTRTWSERRSATES